MPHEDRDFNTEVADVFARLGRGERSPHRLTEEEIAAMRKALEREEEKAPAQKP